MSVAFDTLAYAKELKTGGFTEKQAEVQAHALVRIIDEKLATKPDIDALRLDLRQTEERLKAEIRNTEERLSHHLTVRLGSMLVVAVGVLAALVGIF
jgi:hypothetical protein